MIVTDLDWTQARIPEGEWGYYWIAWDENGEKKIGVYFYDDDDEDFKGQKCAILIDVNNQNNHMMIPKIDITHYIHIGFKNPPSFESMKGRKR